MNEVNAGEIIKAISQYIGYAAVISGAVVGASKKVRDKLKGSIEKHSEKSGIKEEIEEIKSAIATMKEYDGHVQQAQLNTQETLRAQQRSEITRIYYQHLSDKELTGYEKENLQKLYEAYRANQGNSYVRNIVELEMVNWAVKK